MWRVISLWAAALLLLPARLPAVELETLRASGESELLRAWSGRSFAVPQRPHVAPPAATAPLPGSLAAYTSVPLASIANNIRNTNISFAANGRPVKVFGTKSHNTKEWFLGFVEDDGKVSLYKGRKILKWGPWDRHIIIALHGAYFDVQLEGVLTDKPSSRLVIRPARPKPGRAIPTNRRLETGEVDIDPAPVFHREVRDFVGAAYAAGWPLKLDRDYRVLYTDDFNERGDGEFDKYTGERSIALLFYDREGKAAAYHWFEDEIPTDAPGVAVPETKDGADDEKPGSMLAMMIRAPGELLIAYLGQPPAKSKFVVSPNGKPPRD